MGLRHDSLVEDRRWAIALMSFRLAIQEMISLHLCKYVIIFLLWMFGVSFDRSTPSEEPRLPAQALVDELAD